MVILTLVTGIADDARPLNLIKCPDCGKDVSRRAVSCPACGCPGSAIADEANKIDDARVPKPVVTIIAPTGSGYGVAVEQGGKFVIVRLADVGTADSLTIKSVTGEDIPYSTVEVAENLPLVRLAVQGEAVAFLPVSATGEKSHYLNSSGHGAPADQACAAVDSTGAVSTLMDSKSGEAIPLSGIIRWIAVRPGDFRAQASLLARANSEAASDGLKPETRAALSKTTWASPYFKSTSEQLLSKQP